jgi:holo-[acyl-carrier protein] synthase
MILGVGTDICDVARMERELGREGGGFRDSVFTPSEVAYCRGMRYPAQHFAARFAAKEAVRKALAVVGVPSLAWRDVEIERGDGGNPKVLLHGDARREADARRVGEVLVSLSHTNELAVACVVVEARPRDIQGKEGAD